LKKEKDGMNMTTDESNAQEPAKRRNPRMCAGCGKHTSADELVRVVFDPSTGEIAVDLASSAFGRGGHVHASPDCVAKALKSGFSRVFKAAVTTNADMFAEALQGAAHRRIEGLLSGARRAGQLAIGADSVVAALRAGEAFLVVVAKDAAAAARLTEVSRAVAEGQAIAFADKRRLAQIVGKGREPGSSEEVAVIAVLHPGVAGAALQTYRMAAPFASGRSEQVWSSSSEVR
jgi:predicted RNA-binding protein YlxR (DUF448 family)